MESSTALVVLTLSNADFATFLDSYAHQEPDNVAMTLAQLSPPQREMLASYEQLGIDIHTRACRGAARDLLRWPAASGWWDCTELLDNHTQAARWGADALLERYTTAQRRQLMAELGRPPAPPAPEEG